MAKFNDIALNNRMVCALIQDCHANIQKAECNIYAFLENPVGVGDHPNIMETIQEQLDIISKHKDRLNILESTFHEF
tara:strand:+ start:150 stop:380 length:231 start_codon:yes stop_codon:yes gene_type:complete